MLFLRAWIDDRSQILLRNAGTTRKDEVDGSDGSVEISRSRNKLAEVSTAIALLKPALKFRAVQCQSMENRLQSLRQRISGGLMSKQTGFFINSAGLLGFEIYRPVKPTLDELLKFVRNSTISQHREHSGYLSPVREQLAISSHTFQLGLVRLTLCIRLNVLHLIKTYFTNLRTAESDKITDSACREFTIFCMSMNVKSTKQAWLHLVPEGDTAVRVNEFLKRLRDKGFRGDSVSLACRIDKERSGLIRYSTFSSFLCR